MALEPEHPLRTARREIGWTRTELSRRSGISQQAIYLIESGQTLRPAVDTALSLAAALGRPAEALFGSNGSSGSLEESGSVAPAEARSTGIATDGASADRSAAKDSDADLAGAR